MQALVYELDKTYTHFCGFLAYAPHKTSANIRKTDC